MNFKLKEYSFWGTIAKGFNLYLNNFFPIILVSLLCRALVVLVMKFANFEGISVDILPFELGDFLNWITSFMLNLITYCLLSIWISYTVSHKFLETDTDGRDGRQMSTLSLILMAMVFSILVPLAVTAGLFLLIVPGFIFLIRYSLSPQVLAIEKRPVFESLKRSWELTKGNRAIIALYMLVAYQIIVSVNYYTELLLELLKLDSTWMVYAKDAISAFTLPFMPCIFVVIYFNIRIGKEGFNIEHLVQQFSLAKPKPEQSGTEI